MVLVMACWHRENHNGGGGECMVMVGVVRGSENNGDDKVRLGDEAGGVGEMCVKVMKMVVMKMAVLKRCISDEAGDVEETCVVMKIRVLNRCVKWAMEKVYHYLSVISI